MKKHLFVLMTALFFGIQAQSQTVKITQEFVKKIQKYSSLDIFHDGMAAVCNENGLWGYIDTEGNEVIPCMYNRHVGCFSEGLACVPSDDENGVKFINKKNEVVLDKGFKFGARGKFHIYQEASKSYYDDEYDNVSMSAKEDLQNYFSDGNDNSVYDYFNCFRLPCFINGFCTLVYPSPSVDEAEVRCVLECDFVRIDKEGNISQFINQYELKFATNEKHYLCFERIESVHDKPSWLVTCNPIDEPNEYIPFSKELIYDKDYGYTEHLIGLKNSDGKIIVPAKYSQITGFHNGVSLVSIQRGHLIELFPSYEMYSKFGYLDKYGNTTFTLKDMQELIKCEQKIKADIKGKSRSY